MATQKGDGNAVQFLEFPGGEPDEFEASPDLALAQTLAALGEDAEEAQVFVYAIEGKNDAYMFKCSATEFNDGGLDDIRQRYGGGEYRIRVFSNGRVVTHRRVTIKEPKRPPVVEAAPAAALDGLNQLAAAMKAGFEGLAQILVQSQQTKPADSRRELMQDLALMREILVPAAPPPTAGLGETLGLVRQMMEFSRDLAPPTDASGKTDPMAVLYKALEMFGKPLAQGMQAAQAVPPMPGQPVPYQPNPVEALPRHASPEPLGEPDMSFFMKQVVKQILVMAQTGKPAAEVAEMVLDQAPAALLNEMAYDPNWFESLKELVPEVEQQKAWFEEMAAVIRKELTDDEDLMSTAPKSGITSGTAAGGSGSTP